MRDMTWTGRLVIGALVVLLVGLGGVGTSVGIITGGLTGDADGDEVPNFRDNCVTISDPDQLDIDANGIGDACDTTRWIPPAAASSPSPTVNEGDVVALGSVLTGPQPAGMSLSWEQLAGLAVILDLTDPFHPTFTAPQVDWGGITLTFQLTVTAPLKNGTVAPTSISTVNVTIKNVNRAPVADAGDPQTVTEGATFTLSATDRYDPDGDALTYRRRLLVSDPDGVDIPGGNRPGRRDHGLDRAPPSGAHRTGQRPRVRHHVRGRRRPGRAPHRLGVGRSAEEPEAGHADHRRRPGVRLDEGAGPPPSSPSPRRR